MGNEVVREAATWGPLGVMAIMIVVMAVLLLVLNRRLSALTKMAMALRDGLLYTLLAKQGSPRKRRPRAS